MFYIDNLSLIMMALVCLIGLTVASFAWRYLEGDTQRFPFFIQLASLVTSILIIVSANKLWLLLLAWSCSNLLLARLMLHKKSWRAAFYSYKYSLRNFSLGITCIALSFLIIYLTTGYSTVSQLILNKTANTPWLMFACGLLIIGAMTQSALWPFHRWLLSSLNSPTPVSALMHAGIVNGGGFLLVRFAPLLIQQQRLLLMLFAVGIITAIVGTLWQLMQHDIKRSLACSTMGQMGFMMAQCGLGLFPAAISHLFWHGLYKSYLFLATSSAAQHKTPQLRNQLSGTILSHAFAYGVFGSYLFYLSCAHLISCTNTSMILPMLAFISCTQGVLPLLQQSTKRLASALVMVSVIALSYGLSLHLIDGLLTPLRIWLPQPLNTVYILGMALLLGSWLFRLLGLYQKIIPEQLRLKAYVTQLNAAQPYAETITAQRKDYKFE